NPAALATEAPLHAQLLGAVIGHLCNHRLDQHLGTTDIELTDDLSHFPAQLRRAVHDHRVGAFMGLDAHPGIPVAITVGAATAAGAAATAAGAGAIVHVPTFGNAAQHFGHVFGLGVAQIMHLGIAFVADHIQLTDHRAIGRTALG